MDPSTVPLESKTTKHRIAIVFLFLITFLLGGMFSLFLDPYLSNHISNFKKGYALGKDVGYSSGFDIAKKMAENSDVGFFFRNKANPYSLEGTVTKIEKGRISLHIVNNKNPFDTAYISDVVVLIDKNTKLLKQNQKDKNLFENELIKYKQNFVGTYASTSYQGSYPSSILETVIDEKSINVGDLLEITSLKNKEGLQEFLASSITVGIKLFPK